MATKKAKQPASVSDKPEPQTTIVNDPEKHAEEVTLTSDDSLVGVVMADSTKSPPQPQTAYIKDKDD